MHPLLASAGRILLILALVLTGPGLSARAMAATHGHAGHAAVVAHDAAGTVQDAGPKSACRDMAAPSDTAAKPTTSDAHAHAAMAGDHDGPVAMDTAPAAGDCCGSDMGCECDCAQLSAPAATARAVVVPARYGDAPASSANTWRIASPRARLNRPPIA